jgi:hypothetical protein
LTEGRRANVVVKKEEEAVGKWKSCEPSEKG